jgi:hypothetical protein
VLQLAVVVAAAVVGLAGCGPGPAGAGTGRSARATAPAAPAVTPGPQARHVRDAVTARGVTADGAPVDPTATFHAGAPIYLVCMVEGVAPGTSHRLTIRWYLQGQQARSDGSYSYATVTEDGPVSFSVIYPAAGAGLVKLYWDEPVADNSARTNEAFLAQALAFTVR